MEGATTYYSNGITSTVQLANADTIGRQPITYSKDVRPILSHRRQLQEIVDLEPDAMKYGIHELRPVIFHSLVS